MNHEMMDAAIATASARYPNERRIVNQKCDELAYVLQVEGIIVLNHKK